MYFFPEFVLRCFYIIDYREKLSNPDAAPEMQGGERGSGLIIYPFIFFDYYLGEWGEKGSPGLLLGGDIGVGVVGYILTLLNLCYN